MATPAGSSPNHYFGYAPLVFMAHRVRPDFIAVSWLAPPKFRRANPAVSRARHATVVDSIAVECHTPRLHRRVRGLTSTG
jgi:hypothetical protein